MIKLILQFNLFIFSLCSANVSFGQTPPLGSAEDFVLFTAVGAFNNTGVSTVVVGDVGTNVGAFNAFPPGTLVGQIHVADPVSVLAAIDVEIAYNFLVAQTCAQVLSSGLGNGQILNPRIYCIDEASTINGNLILDGQCNPDAVFIFQIDGALSTSTFSTVTFINGASVCNVYWQVNGQVTLGENSVFRGNIIANGALNLLENSSLFGRGLSRAGAISLSTTNVDINQLPTPSTIIINVGGPYCAGESLTLSGNCGGSWSTGSTGSELTVTVSGDYFVTNTNDCGSAISNHILINFTELPACNISGDVSICNGEQTELCVSGGSSYIWTTGATTNCITTGTAGIYEVTITDVNGCTSVCNTTVINSFSECTITGANVVCPGASTQLCVSGGVSYVWSTGASSDCISTGTEGTYSVTITDVNGCTSVCNTTVTVNPLPACTITGANVLCPGASTQLCVSGGSSYIWTTGATTDCISTGTEGTYSVTITDINGCTSVCNTTVTVNPLPACTITGTNILCQGSSTQLCVSGGASYIWSTGATTNCIITGTAGTYMVTITDINGCTSVCSKTVNVDPAPVCAISGSDTFCLGQSSVICAIGGNNYQWSNGEITPCITVSVAGTYTVTVTDSYGCTSVCNKTMVELTTIPYCFIDGETYFCLGDSTEICGPTGPFTYLWSSGEIAETTRCISVYETGTYTLTITDSNGCTNVCSKEVIETEFPVCEITGNTVICEGDSTQLCLPPGYFDYWWEDGKQSNCITVTEPGVYAITVTHIARCQSICSTTVTLLTLPEVVISGNNVFCEGQSSLLCVDGNPENIIWSNGDTTNCITVFASGTYSVTATNHCDTVVSNQIVVTMNPLPVASVINSDSSTVICEGDTITLSGNVNGVWNTGETSPSIEVSSSGIYFVTNANTCDTVVSNQIVVTVSPSPVASLINSDSSNEICEGDTITLSGNVNGIWNTGETSPSIEVSSSGTYFVTNANECGTVVSNSVEVSVTAMPQCHISGNLNPDHDQTTILCAPAGYKFYLWNTLEVSQCINVIESGFKSVTISNNTICVDSCEVLVVYKEVTGTIDSKHLEERLNLKISPNPFNLTTTIEFQNPFPDVDVTIDIYHISGVKVNTFKRFESTTQGMQSIVLDGDKLEPGIYLCKINVGNLSFYKKMILLR